MVRRGRRSDARAFLGLLAELARFEKLQPPDEEAQRRLLQDLFVKRRLELLLATQGSQKVGYALYFFSYSSFLGRPTLYLEDIFVGEKHRKMGVGRSLFRRCVEEASARGCGRMEWAVLSWNRNAIGFYERVGAKRLDEWLVYRLTAEQFEEVARGLGQE